MVSQSRWQGAARSVVYAELDESYQQAAILCEGLHCQEISMLPCGQVTSCNWLASYANLGTA